MHSRFSFVFLSCLFNINTTNKSFILNIKLTIGTFLFCVFFHLSPFVFAPFLVWCLFDFNCLIKIGFSYTVSQVQQYFKVILFNFILFKVSFHVYHHFAFLLMLFFINLRHIFPGKNLDSVLELCRLILCYCIKNETPVCTISSWKKIPKFDVLTKCPILFFGYLSIFIRLSLLIFFTSVSLDFFNGWIGFIFADDWMVSFFWSTFVSSLIQYAFPFPKAGPSGWSLIALLNPSA